MSAAYVVGQLSTLVTPDGVVVAGRDRLADLAGLVDTGLDPAGVVEAISHGSLDHASDFAVVRVSGDAARILVRGALSVRIGSISADGRDATRWTELTLPLADGDVVEVAPVGSTLAGPLLPLTGG
ncbi:hypothetical protein L615_009100000010, partial [Nocardioides sp. J9]